jgi:hypothetical protein
MGGGRSTEHSTRSRNKKSFPFVEARYFKEGGSNTREERIPLFFWELPGKGQALRVGGSFDHEHSFSEETSIG